MLFFHKWRLNLIKTTTAHQSNMTKRGHLKEMKVKSLHRSEIFRIACVCNVVGMATTYNIPFHFKVS